MRQMPLEHASKQDSLTICKGKRWKQLPNRTRVADQKSSEKLTIRITAQERCELEERAKEANLKLSEYARRLLKEAKNDGHKG